MTIWSISRRYSNRKPDKPLGSWESYLSKKITLYPFFRAWKSSGPEFALRMPSESKSYEKTKGAITQMTQRILVTALSAILSIGLLAASASARTLNMSGEWFMNRGQLIDIPINGGAVFCGFGGAGEPIGVGGCLGHKFSVTNATLMHQGAVMFKQANGGIPGAGAVAVSGGSPASFVVPPGAFGQNLGKQVVALPINVTVQQLSTMLILNGPPPVSATVAGGGFEGLTSMNWEARMQANAWSNDPGQTARVAKTFGWCPGVGGPGCGAPGGASAPYNGLVKYSNAGGNGFGGTMAMMATGHGYVSIQLDKALFGFPTGLSPALAHQQFGGAPTASGGLAPYRPQWPGQGYQVSGTNPFPAGPIYNSLMTNTPCIPNALPPNPVGCSQIISQGPQITFPAIPLGCPPGPPFAPCTAGATGAPTMTLFNVPLSLPADNNRNWGFPWSTGTVTVNHTGLTAMGGNDSETISAMGYDNRTPAGNGRIVMVSGGVSHRVGSARNFGALDIVRLDFTSQVPALSPLSIGAVVTLMLLAGGYMARRRFAGESA